MRFFVFLEDEQWHWELRKQRGVATARSPRGFRTYDDVVDAVQNVQNSCDAFIYDLAGNMLEGDAVARFARQGSK